MLAVKITKLMARSGIIIFSVDSRLAMFIPHYGWYFFIWDISRRVSRQGVVFWPGCHEQGIQLYSPLS